VHEFLSLGLNFKDDGRGSWHRPWLFDNEENRKQALLFLRTNNFRRPGSKTARRNLTSLDFADWVNKTFYAGKCVVSERTARNQLVELGGKFGNSIFKKVLCFCVFAPPSPSPPMFVHYCIFCSVCPSQEYNDGHNRKDVVESRLKFVDEMWKLEERMPHWIKRGEQFVHMDDLSLSELAGQPLVCKNTVRVRCFDRHPADSAFSLRQREKPAVLVAQDEMTGHAGDRQTRGWVFSAIKSYQTPEKSPGEGVSVSAFIDGTKILRCTEQQLASINRERASVQPTPLLPIKSNSADKGFICSFQLHIGKANQGYFDAKLYREQAEIAMWIGEELHPGSELILIADHSTTHKAKPEGSLNVDQMAMGWGGAQAKGGLVKIMKEYKSKSSGLIFCFPVVCEFSSSFWRFRSCAFQAG
jgi:hypothetical protein